MKRKINKNMSKAEFALHSCSFRMNNNAWGEQSKTDDINKNETRKSYYEIEFDVNLED